MMMAVAALYGCADHDETSVVNTPVQMSLAFAAPESPAARTRMADNIVQTSGLYYRGLQDIQIIPLVNGEIKPSGVLVGDESARISPLKPNADDPNAAFYYFDDCTFSVGTNSVLFYARAKNDGDEKHVYGSTKAVLPSDYITSKISFSPEPIVDAGADIDAKAEALASYLTAIATTEGWSATTDSKLRALYLNFFRKTDKGSYPVIAGSSANVLALVKELYEEVGKAESDASLAEAVRQNIKNGASVSSDGVVTALDESLSGYPANIGLPDGAVAMQWSEADDQFVPHTAPTVEVAITDVSRFAYPPELYYFVNSPLRTSPNTCGRSTFEDAETWESVLDNHYFSEGVDNNTKSIAIVNPIQYAVAQLSVELQKTSASLEDADGMAVTMTNGLFPLTAVIVGGQYTVGYDFKPIGDEENAGEMRYVYDNQLKTNKVTAIDGTTTDDYFCLNNFEDSKTANTLVFQSYDNPDKEVKIVLEFENKSGQKFKGYDGTVYPGTKFYLIGEIIPMDGDGDTELKKRVFTQDHITKVTVGVESLKKAYNVMPDLLAPRLEIGVQVITEWEEIQPVSQELFNE